MTAAAPLDHLDPRSRVLAALGFSVATTLIDAPGALWAALLVALGLAAAARLPVAATLKKMAALDGFLLASLAIIAVTLPGAPLLTLWDGCAVTDAGAARALVLLLKSNAAGLAALALVAALPPPVLAQALLRLGAPAAMATVFLFSWRYLDLLRRDYARMTQAMRARGFRLGFRPWAWRSMGLAVGMLMVRSLERSDRILAAMRCRGFHGVWPSLTPAPAFGPKDRWFGVVSVCGVAALAVFAR